MKTISLIIGMVLWISWSMQCTPNISMEVYRFKTSTDNYIEVSFYIVGSTLNCNPEQGGEYGVDYMVLIRDTSSAIISGNKYRLSKAGCPAQDIIDVKRYSLPPGKYSIEVEANDLLDTHNVVTISQHVEIEPISGTGSLSDIQLLATIQSQPEISSPHNKSGLYLEPLPFRYYYSSLNHLYLYLETYHTETLDGQPYLQYTIKPAVGDIPKPIIAYKKTKKEEVSASIFQLDITSLVSGPYVLEAALFDGNKQIRDLKQVTFSRFNPVGDSLFMATYGSGLDYGFVSKIAEDSLEYVLRAMAPIANSMEVDLINTLVKKGNANARRYFIHKYWTDHAANMASAAFEGYMKVARVVDDNYRSGFGYGFESDRGHIFLKYGKPDETIPIEDEPSAPPYEIWFYTTFPATHQNNVRFLFYNPSLIKNGHELLHSTAIGELYNERWEVELYKDATLETPGVGATEMPDNVYRNARQYFEY